MFLGAVVWNNLIEWQKRQNLIYLFSGNANQATFTSPTKSVNCQIYGAYPDKDCTPGSVFPDANPKEICVAGYTQTVRSVSTGLRKQIYAAYGFSFPQPSGSFEVDHFVPLALGGNNDPANLWPEAASPVPGFKEKDVVEVYLQEEVCAGRVSLNVAQHQIADDWLLVYKNLSADTVKRIKAKYSNWSN